MKHFNLSLIALAAAMLLPLVASAGEVRHREANQQARIGQGIQSGQITAGGAANLERREANINASRATDLSANGGHLTGQEYRNLNRRENALSSRIYTDKHNDIAQPASHPAERHPASSKEFPMRTCLKKGRLFRAFVIGAAILAGPVLTASPAEAWWRHPGWAGGPVWYRPYGPRWHARWAYRPCCWRPRFIARPLVVFPPPYVVVR